MSDCPTFTVRAEGVTERLESVAGGGPGAVTVITVVPEIAPRAARIVVEPAATAVASPLVLIVAVAVLVDVQVGEAHGWLEPSVKLQVARNWKVFPATTLGVAGVTMMLESTAEQVCVVVGEKPSIETVIVAEPVPAQSNSCVLVSPPPVGLVTIAVLLELHTAVAVTFRLVPSDIASVAVYCTPPGWPCGMVGASGEIVRPVGVGVGGMTATQVNGEEPEMPL